MADLICTDCGTRGHDNCLSGGQYPRPWRIEVRCGTDFVVDASGGIVAGGFPHRLAAIDWLDAWPNPVHTVHTDDCMSEWGESRRHLLSAATIAANHELHMHDVRRARLEGKFCRHGLTRDVHAPGTC